MHLWSICSLRSEFHFSGDAFVPCCIMGVASCCCEYKSGFKGAFFWKQRSLQFCLPVYTHSRTYTHTHTQLLMWSNTHSLSMTEIHITHSRMYNPHMHTQHFILQVFHVSYSYHSFCCPPIVCQATCWTVSQQDFLLHHQLIYLLECFCLFF